MCDGFLASLFSEADLGRGGEWIGCSATLPPFFKRQNIKKIAKGCECYGRYKRKRNVIHQRQFFSELPSPDDHTIRATVFI